MTFSNKETVKQALREAITRRQQDMERFVLELQRIEKDEQELQENMDKYMQNGSFQP